MGSVARGRSLRVCAARGCGGEGGREKGAHARRRARRARDGGAGRGRHTLADGRGRHVAPRRHIVLSQQYVARLLLRRDKPAAGRSAPVLAVLPLRKCSAPQSHPQFPVHVSDCRPTRAEEDVTRGAAGAVGLPKAVQCGVVARRGAEPPRVELAPKAARGGRVSSGRRRRRAPSSFRRRMAARGHFLAKNVIFR
ncbi:hypothetical protein EVAR_77541_1 [Eumeta japonica]|uniref:Uncharacterized protein n=1 Tax=Eumeta variegata TaxID=151549 RepID=A0A4C1T6K4_EUMVA|nr:hypothetical protein EVAR_77541_1 [Eumeta japonica]